MASIIASSWEGTRNGRSGESRLSRPCVRPVVVVVKVRTLVTISKQNSRAIDTIERRKLASVTVKRSGTGSGADQAQRTGLPVGS
ncbi:MAG: hypothetical protein M3O34_13195 [Chloroflexota bacterium]|nr:hypothetical protein [Chloroflexota bacterium]